MAESEDTGNSPVDIDREAAQRDEPARRHGGRARLRSPPRSSIPAGIRKLPSPPTTLEQAQMEWDLVATVQPGIFILFR